MNNITLIKQIYFQIVVFSEQQAKCESNSTNSLRFCEYC